MSENKKIFYAFLILSTALFVLRLPTLFELPWLDQSYFAYTGQRIRAGQLLYKELGAQYPPGIFFFYTLISYIGGGQPWVIPLTDAFYALLTMGAIFLLAKSFWGSRAALGAAFIFFLFSLSPAYQGFWSRNRAELLINLPLIISIYGGYQAYTKGKNWLWIFSGLALGIAFTIKFSALLLALPLIFLIWISPPTGLSAMSYRIKIFFYLICGWMLPVIAVILYLYFRGILSEAYEGVITYNYAYANMMMELKPLLALILINLNRSLVFSLTILPLALIGFWLGKIYRSVTGWILILWILGGLLSVLLQWKFFWPHFMFLLPPFSLLLGFSWQLIKIKKEEKYSLAISLIVIILFVFASVDVFKGHWRYYRAGFTFLYKNTSYERMVYSLPINFDKIGFRETGKFIAKNSQEKDYIFVWALAPDIYYYSGRPPANRFIYQHYLIHPQNPLARELPGIQQRQQEVLSSLKEKPVKFFVVGLADVSIFQDRDSLALLKDFPELYLWVQNNYFFAAQKDRFIILQRKQSESKK